MPRVYLKNLHFLIHERDIRAQLAEDGCAEGLRHVHIVRKGSVLTNNLCSAFLTFDTHEQVCRVVATWCYFRIPRLGPHEIFADEAADVQYNLQPKSKAMPSTHQWHACPEERTEGHPSVQPQWQQAAAGPVPQVMVPKHPAHPPPPHLLAGGQTQHAGSTDAEPVSEYVQSVPVDVQAASAPAEHKPVPVLAFYQAGPADVQAVPAEVQMVPGFLGQDVPAQNVSDLNFTAEAWLCLLNIQNIHLHGLLLAHPLCICCICF